MAPKHARKLPPKPTSAPATRASPSVRGGMALSQMNIKQAVDLGDGFVLVKLDIDADMANAQSAALYDLALPAFLDAFPKIPDEHVNALFKRTTLGGEPVVPSENALFMARFERQELDNREALAQRGHLLESGQLADEMKIKRQAISKAVQERRMFSLDGSAGRRLYPAFFAAPQLDRKQVQTVSRALGDLPGPSKWQFFTTPKVSLGGKTAIEALEAGQLAAVLVAAAGFVES